MAKDELIFLIQRYGYARRNGTHQGKKSAEWMREIETALEATGPERDLAEQALEKLEWLAREHKTIITIRGLLLDIIGAGPLAERNVPTGGVVYRLWGRNDRDPPQLITRAEALALLREKGAK